MTEPAFARRLFTIAAVYGLLALLPQYAIVPVGLSHPEYFYGFIGVASAWQFAFLIIAYDPLRYRLLILPGIIEKLGFGVAALVLFVQGRSPALIALGGGVDLLFAALFLRCFARLGRARA